MDRMSEFGGLI